MKSNQVYDWPALCELYVGKSGSGKTSLFWKNFLSQKAKWKFIYDHKAMEFSIRFLKTKPIFDLEGLVEATARGGVIPFSPARMFPGDPEGGFEFFCEYVFEVSEKLKGRKLFVADELQKLVGTNSKPKPLLQLCDIGRTYQIDKFFMASASNAIHNLVLSQITSCYCFLHGNKKNCGWEDDFGFDTDEICNLKKGEYVWLNDSGETRKGGKAF